MSLDRSAVQSRAAQFREKAAELRRLVERSPGLKHDFAKLAAEYERMASQLEGAAKEHR